MSVHCPHCGVEIVKGGAVRSLPQHRRYFGLIKAIYDNWPEGHAEQFSSPEDCRKWLQMKAGYREVGATIPLTGMRPDRAVMLAEAAIRAAGSYARPVIHGDNLVVWRPKSIAFDRLGHIAFCSLQKEVEDVIKAETGIDPDKVFEAESAA